MTAHDPICTKCATQEDGSTPTECTCGDYPIAPVAVTGIHLMRLGDSVVVRAEIDGVWVCVIQENYYGEFSHIVEPDGMRKAHADLIASVMAADDEPDKSDIPDEGYSSNRSNVW